MREDLMSNTEEATYQSLDIVNCAVAATILDETDNFDYGYEDLYSQETESNDVITDVYGKR